MSWNQSLKIRSWLKALSFVMVGKMDQDFPGWESTAPAQRSVWSHLRPDRRRAGTCWSDRICSPMVTKSAMVCSLCFRPHTAAMHSYPRLWLCPLLLRPLTAPAPCVTPGAVPRASWVLRDSLGGLDPPLGWVSHLLYRAINWREIVKNLMMYKRVDFSLKH